MMRRPRSNGERAEYPSDDAESKGVAEALGVVVDRNSVEDGGAGRRNGDRDPAVDDEVDQCAPRPSLDGELNKHRGPSRRQGAQAPQHRNAA